MWASCMFIHEMRLQSSASVYIAEHSLPLFLLGLEGKSSLSLCLFHLILSLHLLLYLLSVHSLRIVSQLVG